MRIEPKPRARIPFTAQSKSVAASDGDIGYDPVKNPLREPSKWITGFSNCPTG